MEGLEQGERDAETLGPGAGEGFRPREQGEAEAAEPGAGAEADHQRPAAARTDPPGAQGVQAGGEVHRRRAEQRLGARPEEEDPHGPEERRRQTERPEARRREPGEQGDGGRGGEDGGVDDADPGLHGEHHEEDRQGEERRHGVPEVGEHPEQRGLGRRRVPRRHRAGPALQQPALPRGHTEQELGAPAAVEGVDRPRQAGDQRSCELALGVGDGKLDIDVLTPRCDLVRLIAHGNKVIGKDLK